MNWISVSVRLPDEGDNVLACIKFGAFREADVLSIDCDAVWRYPDGESVDGVVTHWLPIPPLPEVKA